MSGRLTKWAIELSEFDIQYLAKAAHKGQAAVDFVAEFTEPDVEVCRMMEKDQGKNYHWKLHMDGLSNTHGNRRG